LLLIGTIDCRIYVYNYAACECLMFFDLGDYRQKQGYKFDKNLCYYMSPYSQFDTVFNPVVLVLDKFGASLINLSERTLF
jgi:hypothetical protein